MQFDLNFIYIIVQVIFLEGILSIDNAAVLGAMVSVLPKEDMIPWPHSLKSFGPPVHRVLGGQRGAALKVGLLGAYLGRALMLVMASFVIRNHYLKILGAAYLIKLAFENLGEPEPGEEAQTRSRSVEGKGFWSVVIAVELADLAFSLDNARIDARSHWRESPREFWCGPYSRITIAARRSTCSLHQLAIVSW